MRGARVEVRLDAAEVALLDAQRGGLSRAGCLRRLLAESEHRPPSPSPTFDEMLTLLGDQARAGRTAATIAAARLLADRERHGEPEAAAIQRRRDDLAARRARRVMVP